MKKPIGSISIYKLIFKRVLIAVPLLIGITLLSFIVMQLAPGEPGAMFLDPSMSAEDILQIRRNLGLDKPLIVQYGYWLISIFKGNFGYSFSTGKPVLSAIAERLPATLILSLSSLVLILILTFPLGLISGYKKGSRFDNLVTIFTFIGLSLPTFWLGLQLILIFSLKLNLFPSSGFMDPLLNDSSFWQQGLSVMRHLFLPLLTILIGGLAGLTRYYRFGIIKILAEDYIKAASARGISIRRILFKHAFKNAALPIVTILGLSLPSLISGAFVIEYIFSWPGLGQLGIAAVFSRDYPVLMGTLFFSSLLIIIGNLGADIAYRFIDPRIKK
ncbi:ABC transporter permease [Candidatus Margulisiibacteriota bacterium]